MKLTMKLWSKHWVTLNSRPLSRRSEAEVPLLLVSIEKDTLASHIPIITKPVFRHYMSNVFMYLMPADADVDSSKRGLVHGWELKLGMPIEEAKELVSQLIEAIELSEKRREERHKQTDREEY